MSNHTFYDCKRLYTQETTWYLYASLGSVLLELGILKYDLAFMVYQEDETERSILGVMWDYSNDVEPRTYRT